MLFRSGSLMGARGNSGVILSQLFRGFASGVNDKAVIDSRTMAEALKKAADTAYKAVMKPTEGTILTVARECGDKAMEIYPKHDDIAELLDIVIKHGNEILKKTPEMLPVLKQAGVVDAGGKGLLYIFSGAYNFLVDDSGITKTRQEAAPPSQSSAPATAPRRCGARTPTPRSRWLQSPAG